MEENRTYTRNFVRSYARAACINEEKIVRALNLQQRGEYNGELLADKRRDEMNKTSDPKSSASRTSTASRNDDLNRDESVKNVSTEDWKSICAGDKLKHKSGFNSGKVGQVTLILLGIYLAFVVYYFL